ncbi:MAG: transcriptional activator RfaH [Rhodospirillales bacterium]|nr:transcriptional activator RfaH [Rhodospirillales bacterium]
MTHWCAVQTHVRSEDKAAFHLRRQGYEVFLPKHLKRRKHARRIDWVPSPLFPRYLFVSLDPEASRWWSIRSTVGVSNLVCFDNQPATVPEAIINEIMDREDHKGLVKTHTGCAFKAGDRVRIINGPLCDQAGLFDCPTDEERVFILLNLMGREVKVRVPLETVYACA